MSNHEEDKLFKYATKEDGFSFINLIEEINWDIRKYDFKSENLTFNPTELIELDPAVYKSDMIMELDSIIVMTEFQSTVVKKFDEKRYRLYTAIVDYAKQNNKPILLIVFSTAEKTKIKQYKLNKDCVFTIPIISLKDFDGDEIINNIENKKQKHIHCTDTDIHTDRTWFNLCRKYQKRINITDTQSTFCCFGIFFKYIRHFIRFGLGLRIL